MYTQYRFNSHKQSKIYTRVTVMLQPDRAIFRELCTVKSNLKTNAVFIKYYNMSND
jgi:hypothetical protein